MSLRFTPTVLGQVQKELESKLIGQRLKRIIQLGRSDLALDFDLVSGEFLFVSIDPRDPRTYLINRRLRDLLRSSTGPTLFTVAIERHFSGRELISVKQLGHDRILKLVFADDHETSNSMIVQLAGRSANLFILDENETILETARKADFVGQRSNEKYLPPQFNPLLVEEDAALIDSSGETISQLLDRHYLKTAELQQFDSVVTSAEKRVAAEKRKLQKLSSRLDADLAAHGTADIWKRFGDLLLANGSAVILKEGSILVVDYFDESQSQIEIENAENLPPIELAEYFFRRYRKAKNAALEIVRRKDAIANEIEKLADRSREIEIAVAARDHDALAKIATPHTAQPTEKTRLKKKDVAAKGARSFISSDGFEILVGKKAKDNDFLTFRIAKSLDIWLHAADYAGSHVVIRNPNRKEVPQKTLLEAAQLAAFYSQAKKQPKAAVNYTQKKFVNKRKGAAAGLVSLSSFKTLLVVPEFPPVVATSVD